MTRPIAVLGAAILTLSLGASAWWLTRRTPGAPPQEEAVQPFRVGAVGAGRYIELQPPPAPLRNLRWTAPLPGGAGVAQILTQTGRQQVAIFLQGEPGPAFVLPPPAGAPDPFFQFAELVDAALAPGEALVLLYRGAGDSAAPPLVLAWDLRTQLIRWSHRAPGEHLALAPDRRSVFLYGSGTAVHILDLAGHARKTGPQITTVDLHPALETISSLLPTGSRSFLVAHASGLSAWRNGEWTHAPAPVSSPLGFARGLGKLAGNAKTGWWQPEPGTLIPLGPHGAQGAPRNLATLLPDAESLDAGLLRLLGEDPDGQLWFGLARPALPALAPVPEPLPDSAAPEPALPGLPPAALPIQPSREAWDAHLRNGLDRLYCWKPGEGRMKVVTLPEAWKRLAPPPGLPCPGGEDGFRPESGALLCGGPERVWWLPLSALQPR
ncbi:MAG: hypothetical protein NDI58_07940 [Geothrix sp.]|nr:hypothetical protein [Geothrix sp.]